MICRARWRSIEEAAHNCRFWLSFVRAYFRIFMDPALEIYSMGRYAFRNLRNLLSGARQGSTLVLVSIAVLYLIWSCQLKHMHAEGTLKHSFGFVNRDSGRCTGNGGARQVPCRRVDGNKESVRFVTNEPSNTHGLPKCGRKQTFPGHGMCASASVAALRLL